MLLGFNTFRLTVLGLVSTDRSRADSSMFGHASACAVAMSPFSLPRASQRPLLVLFDLSSHVCTRAAH